METATQALHRLTSYEPGRDWDEPIDDPRVLQDLETNDLERLPWFYKHYEESLPRIELPRELPSTTAPAVAVLAGTAGVAPAALDLGQLSRILHLAAGVVRTVERPYATWLFRAAGSAGARFPLELYVAVPEAAGLPAGVHWYHPQEHALMQVGPAPVGGAPAIVVTGVPWRTGWRYRERGYRHVYWDSGTMLAQLLATADSAGLTASLYSRFPDRSVARLVGADGVHEWPVAVVSLGEKPPALEAAGSPAAGEVDAEPLEFPLATAAQRAGELEALGEPWARGEAVAVPEQGTEPLEDVVLSRSSQRRMDPARSLSESVVRSILSAALRNVDLPHFVVVHAVDGVEPGVYRWPDLSSPMRPGELRKELYRVCIDQGLPRDAAFVVIGAADVGALDDRDYREAQLTAGLVEGRLHLAAYALGAGASGMTFLDSEIPELLGEPLNGLLFTCVGVPEYRSKAGGLPGEPTEFRQVTPRLDDEDE
ncbi:MAG: nitroreductase family protein [Gaiellaceae bacterium]